MGALVQQEDLSLEQVRRLLEAMGLVDSVEQVLKEGSEDELPALRL